MQSRFSLSIIMTKQIHTNSNVNFFQSINFKPTFLMFFRNSDYLCTYKIIIADYLTVFAIITNYVEWISTFVHEAHAPNLKSKIMLTNIA